MSAPLRITRGEGVCDLPVTPPPEFAYVLMSQTNHLINKRPYVPNQSLSQQTPEPLNTAEGPISVIVQTMLLLNSPEFENLTAQGTRSWSNLLLNRCRRSDPKFSYICGTTNGVL